LYSTAGPACSEPMANPNSTDARIDRFFIIPTVYPERVNESRILFDTNSSFSGGSRVFGNEDGLVAGPFGQIDDSISHAIANLPMGRPWDGCGIDQHDRENAV